ncbi:MAG: cereblon family protein [Pseudomonadota bacterium]
MDSYQQDLELSDQGVDGEFDRQVWLRCAVCSAPITPQSAVCDWNDAHVHIKTNPAGISFDLRIFDLAPGCRCVGGRYFADTWFAGFCWTIALCSSCGLHLGWYFSNEESTDFYALIAPQLVEDK